MCLSDGHPLKPDVHLLPLTSPNFYQGLRNSEGRTSPLHPTGPVRTLMNWLSYVVFTTNSQRSGPEKSPTVK